MDNKYKECVDNFETIIKELDYMFGQEDKAIAEFNIMYLKQQPQYGEPPIIH